MSKSKHQATNKQIIQRLKNLRKAFLVNIEYKQPNDYIVMLDKILDIIGDFN